MAQNISFEKIQHFVKDQINAKIVITKTTDGYKVNDFSIRESKDFWVILDSNNHEIERLRNKRMALLLAGTLFKKKYHNARSIFYLDTVLSTLKHDKKLFEQKIINSIKQDLFEDRYSKTVIELEQLYKQINDLEKSVGLQ